MSKLLVSTIPIYTKKGEKSSFYMEMKDFYLFSALISDFEILYGNKLKNAKDSTFKYFNENPKEAFLWYIDEIIKAVKNAPGAITELGKAFRYNYEFALSMKKYLDSKELNILEKEKNSDASILDIFSHIVNNNFGASYVVYNSTGKYEIKQMYQQNFNNIYVNTALFSHMMRNSNPKIYDIEKAKADISKLFSNLNDDTDLLTIPREKKILITRYLQSKTGLLLSYIGFDDLIEDIKTYSKENIVDVTALKNLLLGLVTNLSSDYTIVEAKRKELKKLSRGDATTSEYIPNAVGDSLFKALTSAYLVNYVMKPVMNIKMFSGEQLPTFKIATLAQKDTELYEVQRGFEKKHAGNSVFKSLLIRDQAAIIGTGTKLEIVNEKENKQAAKFNVSENFTSDFHFDFLQNIINNNTFAVMIGNYSDKNTIITKIIDGTFSIDGKTPILKLSTEKLLSEVRTQAGNYYKDTLNKIFADYFKLLDLPKSKSIEDNITKINNALKTINVRDLSKKASDLKINFTEELHYSTYNGVTSLNQLIVDNFRIFNDASLFKEFVAIQEASMLSKFKKYNSTVANGNSLKFSGKFSPKQALSALNISEEEFDERPDSKGKDFSKLVGATGLNPLLKRWL